MSFVFLVELLFSFDDEGEPDFEALDELGEEELDLDALDGKLDNLTDNKLDLLGYFDSVLAPSIST